jgi:hypothetical protein
VTIPLVDVTANGMPDGGPEADSHELALDDVSPYLWRVQPLDGRPGPLQVRVSSRAPVNTPTTLPTIIEVKRTLAGVEERFECQVLARTPTHMAVLWIVPDIMHVHGVDLPAGTVSVGHFWTDRPYNVYHWLRTDQTTLGYYFNLADRTAWTAERLEWRDLTVDVLAMPKGGLDVLDEDELPAELDAEARGHIDAGKAALLGKTAAVLAEVEAASRAVLPLAAFAFVGAA